MYLGQTIERLAGEDFEVYMQKNVLSPLGMTAQLLRHHAVPPDRRPLEQLLHEGRQGSRRDGLDFDTGITTSNGGLNSPLSDMAKYLVFLLGGAADEGMGGELPLARASLEEMWKPVIPAGGNATRKGSVGLGYFLTEFPDGDRLIGHTGEARPGSAPSSGFTRRARPRSLRSSTPQLNRKARVLK